MGIYFYFSFSIASLFALGTLSAFTSFYHQRLALFFFIFGSILSYLYYSVPNIPEEGLKTEIFFIPQEKKDATKWKGSPTFKYKGVATSRTLPLKNLPVVLYFPAKKEELSCLKTYQIQGTLFSRKGAKFGFSPDKKISLKPIEDQFSLGEARFYLKTKIKALIHSFPIPYETKNFISGMLTGQFKQNPVTQEISRVGLSHLLAISGFHFSLVSLCSYLAFRLWLSLRAAQLASLTFVFFYFLFLGPSPSITRAFIMISLALLAPIFQKESNALNNLGIALLVILIPNPMVALDLGFQFSFLATASILIFYSPIYQGLVSFFPSPSLSVLLGKKRWEQGLFLFKNLAFQSLALNLAVHMTVAPLSLFIFGKFPLLSFPFNLFSPPWVSFGMFFVLGSLFLFPLEILFGWPLFQIGAQILAKFIRLCCIYPLELNKVLRYNNLSFNDLSMYLILLFCLGILLSSKQEDKQPFAFV